MTKLKTLYFFIACILLTQTSSAGYDGYVWRKVNENFNNSVVYSLKGLGTTVFAGSSFGPGHKAAIYCSKDSGDHWQLLKEFQSANDTIKGFAVLGNTIFASNSDSGIYVSADTGTTWKQIFYLPGNHGYHIATRNNVVIVGTASGEIHRSADTGKTWSKIILPPTCNKILSINSDSNYLFAATCKDLLRSTDNGLSWSKVYSGTSGGFPLEGMCFFYDTFYPSFILGYSGYDLYRSIDSGLTWLDYCPTDLGHKRVGKKTCAAIFNRRHSNQHEILLGAEYGMTWSWGNYYSYPYAWQHFTHCILDSNKKGSMLYYTNAIEQVGNYVFCANSKGVFRIDADSVVSVSHVSQSAEHRSKVYPNPIQEMLYIQDLVKGTGITLYDILGRIVFSQIATNENETINTRQLPTGSYVLQLTYPDGTKNIVKVLKE